MRKQVICNQGIIVLFVSCHNTTQNDTLLIYDLQFKLLYETLQNQCLDFFLLDESNLFALRKFRPACLIHEDQIVCEFDIPDIFNRIVSRGYGLGSFTNSLQRGEYIVTLAWERFVCFTQLQQQNSTYLDVGPLVITAATVVQRAEKCFLIVTGFL